MTAFFLPLVLVTMLAGHAVKAQTSDEPPIFAMASSLRGVGQKLVQAFQSDQNKQPTLVFGATAILARQIEAGAPFSLFIAADQASIIRLTRRGLIDQAASGVFAGGQLAFVTRRGGQLAPDMQLNGVRARLQTGRLRRFVIANPAFAPYGQAAKAYLRHYGLWDELQAGKHLLLAENVASALHLALAGGNEGGLVAASLILGGARGVESEDGRSLNIDYLLLPPLPNGPRLTYNYAMISTAPLEQQNIAADFARFLTSPAAQQIMKSHGLLIIDSDGQKGGE